MINATIIPSGALLEYNQYLIKRVRNLKKYELNPDLKFTNFTMTNDMFQIGTDLLLEKLEELFKNTSKSILEYVGYEDRLKKLSKQVEIGIDIAAKNYVKSNKTPDPPAPLKDWMTFQRKAKLKRISKL